MARARYSLRSVLARATASSNRWSGRCWKLRQLQMKDEDNVEFSTEPLFFTILNDCLVGRARTC